MRLFDDTIRGLLCRAPRDEVPCGGLRHSMLFPLISEQRDGMRAIREAAKRRDAHELDAHGYIHRTTFKASVSRQEWNAFTERPSRA